jgi:hypothetical protein
MKGIKGEKMLNVTTKDKSVVVQWPVWGGHGIDLGVARQGLWGFLSFFFFFFFFFVIGSCKDVRSG